MSATGTVLSYGPAPVPRALIKYPPMAWLQTAAHLQA
jgi:hypothetical protein